MTEDLPMPRFLAAMRRSRGQSHCQIRAAGTTKHCAELAVAATCKDLKRGENQPLAAPQLNKRALSATARNASSNTESAKLESGKAATGSARAASSNVKDHPGAFVPASLKVTPENSFAANTENLGFVPRPKLVWLLPGLISWLRMPRRPVLATVMLAMVFGGAYIYAGANDQSTRPLAARMDDLAAALGLGIDQVSLEGHRFTSDGDIFDALALDRYRTMLSFSIVDARARVEALPWVARANIIRELPNKLRVKVHERAAFALWRDGEKYKKIDRKGHVLALTRADGADELPLVMGKGAAPLAQHILALVAKYPELARRLVAAQRVGGRRWTLWLAGSGRNHRHETAILLPEKDPEKALERLQRIDRRRSILAQPLAMIDLRQEARLTLRQAAPVSHRARRSFTGQHARSQQTTAVEEL